MLSRYRQREDRLGQPYDRPIAICDSPNMSLPCSNLSQPHVLYLIDTFHRTTGGAERALINIVRYLSPDRYRCSVATFASSPDVIDIHNQFSCPVYVLPLRRTYDWNALHVAWRLRQIIRSQRVSIVHTFFETSDLWGGMIARLSGCQVLISSRRDMGILRQPKHRIAYRLLRGMFDQVQAVSEEVRAFAIREDGLEVDQAVTLPNGVDLQEIDRVSRLPRASIAASAEKASHLVVTVGNLRAVKGIDVLIRAVPLVCREFPRCLFLVIGEPTDQIYFDKLQALARSLNVMNNFCFLGRRDDTCSLVKSCDVFCLPSRSEGMSNALLEAMACGLPCVATEIGGNGELIREGFNGFLVPSENPELIAKRIQLLLQDRAIARLMGRRSRGIIESNFTVQMMVARLVSEYDRLLRRRESFGSRMS
jgi:glycosyltransferase involved in cell wall biosynthesis